MQKSSTLWKKSCDLFNMTYTYHHAGQTSHGIHTGVCATQTMNDHGYTSILLNPKTVLQLLAAFPSDSDFD